MDNKYDFESEEPTSIWKFADVQICALHHYVEN